MRPPYCNHPTPPTRSLPTSSPSVNLVTPTPRPHTRRVPQLTMVPPVPPARCPAAKDARWCMCTGPLTSPACLSLSLAHLPLSPCNLACPHLPIAPFTLLSFVRSLVRCDLVCPLCNQCNLDRLRQCYTASRAGRLAGTAAGTLLHSFSALCRHKCMLLFFSALLKLSKEAGDKSSATGWHLARLEAQVWPAGLGKLGWVRRRCHAVAAHGGAPLLAPQSVQALCGSSQRVLNATALWPFRACKRFVAPHSESSMQQHCGPSERVHKVLHDAHAVVGDD